MRSLDHHARDSLKLSGWDYRHGTGHGVGFYLLVHECPPTFGYEMPFEEGMTISVEPGVYLENEFGIRIENVAYVIGDNADTFSFESFTRVPYCSKLIDSSLLSNEQKEWLNKYNANIREVILPLVADDLTKVWILDNTNTIE
ncbi:M24 family metallopeptidase C-terminal domain-containing protein [Entamoeba marina]